MRSRPRAQVAALVGAQASELVWTSGETESNNLALKGAAFGHASERILYGATEHPAVLEAAAALRTQGQPVEVFSRSGTVACGATRVEPRGLRRFAPGPVGWLAGVMRLFRCCHLPISDAEPDRFHPNSRPLLFHSRTGSLSEPKRFGRSSQLQVGVLGRLIGPWYLLWGKRHVDAARIQQVPFRGPRGSVSSRRSSCFRRLHAACIADGALFRIMEPGAVP
jgi:hypothetical protein